MRLHSSPSASTLCRTLPTIFPPVAQKRCRQPSPSPLPASTTLAEAEPEASLPPTTGASSFRNVSACHRCRRRKNKCDKRLPACLTCERAGEKCVGHDPILQRDIPRRYAALCTPLIPFSKYNRSNPILTATSITSRNAMNILSHC